MIDRPDPRPPGQSGYDQEEEDLIRRELADRAQQQKSYSKEEEEKIKDELENGKRHR